MANKTFEQATAEIINKVATEYKSVFIDKEYLLFSVGFNQTKYYIITGSNKNFYHLTGVQSSLYPVSFYTKALTGSLTEEHVGTVKTKKSGQKEDVKGSIRKKRTALPEMVSFFQNPLFAEEGFEKNNIRCRLASSNGNCTIGFTQDRKLVPQTLLKGDKLSSNKVKVDLVLSMPKNSTKFTSIEYGNINLIKGETDILNMLSEDLLKSITT